MRTTLFLFGFLSAVQSMSGPTCKAQPAPTTVTHQDLSRFIDRSGNVQLIRTPDHWALRRRAILKGFQEAAGTLPSRQDLPAFDLQITSDEMFQGVRRLSGTIQAGAADRLPLDLYLPDQFLKSGDAEQLFGAQTANAVPGILALHPTGAPGKRIIAGERPNRQYAIELAQRGYVVVAPDYPSFGQYSYDFDADSYTSGSMKGIFNHMRCVDLLTALRIVDADRIGTIGHSLGGHNAIFTAVFDERIKVIVSSCGWTPFHHYYGGNLKGWTSPRYMPLIREQYGLDPDKVPFDFYELIAALAPRTFVSISPLSDSNFDVAGVRQAIPLARQIYRLLGAEEAIQLFTPACEHDFPTDMRLSSYEIMDRVLEFAPQSIDPDYSTELPRIGPTEPEGADATFETASGYTIQQTAAEPLVTDPVAVAFDEDGQLYVVEMKGYSEQAEELRGLIRVLNDTDDDGVFDSSHVFAKGFSWPTAIAVHDGGVFVGAAPDIVFLKDTDNDGTADQRNVVFTGFGKGNVQGLLNSFRWGQDGRIYGATSSAAGEITTPTQPDRPTVALRSRDFSFDPARLDLREETGGAQHGMSFDDFGDRFVCSNSDHAQAIVFNQRYLNANPSVKPAPARVMIAADGGQAPVFRVSPVEPWRIVRTRLRVSGRVPGPVEGGGTAAGYFTGATGITVYRGDAWPPEMRGDLIIGDVGSNIVHRKRLRRRGPIWTATRIDEGKELVASTDVWFRPVQFANAPDGCLHVLDMYRETIEHPASLPPEIKRHVDLTSGRDRGRLYRIAPDGYTHRPAPKLSKATVQELVALLGHPNGWHADTASRLLYERADPATSEYLRATLANSLPPAAIVRRLSLLAHLNQLDPSVAAEFVTHRHPRVRERAALVSEPLLKNDQLFAAVSELVRDKDDRVRLQAGFSLGMTNSVNRVAPLTSLLVNDGNDQWIRTAAFTSLREQSWNAFTRLLVNERFLSAPHAKTVLTEAIGVALRRPDAPTAETVVAAIQQIDPSSGLQHDLLQLIIKLRNNWRDIPPIAALTQSVILAAEELLADTSTDESQRRHAIQSLSLSTWNAHGVLLVRLLNPAQTPAIQIAAMQTLADYSDANVAEALIRQWREFTPAVRKLALAAMLTRTAWSRLLLSAIDGGEISSSTLTSTELRRLAEHPDRDIRQAALQMMEHSETSTRQHVLEAYRPALVMPGDIDRGAQVFRTTCSVCHKVGTVGYEVGPNLLSTRNRGSEFILLNVLDPNREVLPAWHDYVAVTNDGRSTNGIITQESPVSVTLRRAEAKESKPQRSDLDALVDTGRSLMPEDLEKTVSIQQMADLLAWIQAQ